MPRIALTGVVEVARSFEGAPFFNHFVPDLCENGDITTNRCVELGLDEEGMDCSGLVIRSISAAAGLDYRKWPVNLRHAEQMSRFGIPAEQLAAMPGDIVVYKQGLHLGVYAGKERIVHASNEEKRVCLGKLGQPEKIIPALALASLVELEERATAAMAMRNRAEALLVD